MHVLLALLAVQQAIPPPSFPVSDTAHVVIVATTDVHGRVLGWDYVRDVAGSGGVSRAPTRIETLRGPDSAQDRLVDAGGPVQGHPFAGEFAAGDPPPP